MAVPKWQFFLAESATLTRIAEITDARDKSLSLALNRSGSASFNVPLQSDWIDYFNPMLNCIIVQKNNEVIWSGPIWTTEEDFASSRMSVNAVGWFEILFKRYLKEAIEFDNVSGGAIAQLLLTEANADFTTWISNGTNGDDMARTVEYEVLQNVGQEIQSLSEVEAGFDFWVHPETRQLHTYRYDDYTDRPEIQFGFNIGAHNLASFGRSINADEMRNQIIVQGDNEAWIANEEDYWPDYNLFTEVISLTETNDDTILQAIANAEVAVNKLPRVVLSFVPKAEGAANSYTLFEDYNIGDKVYVSAKRQERTVTDQAVRIFGVDVNITNNGIEQVTSIKTSFEGG
jgi:hypothetical protein